MERIIKIHIKQLPEGVYLATSDEVQGLVAQGRTIIETLEIARDVAKKLLETQGKLPEPLTVIKKSLDIPLVLDI